jgi:MYXO-CTERM domain-containing protein
MDRVSLWIATLAALAAPSLAAAQTCDVQAEDGGGCAAGECCFFDADYVPVCVASGGATQDAPCEAPNDCGCGYICVGVPGTCAHWCGLGDPSDPTMCPEGALCSVSLPDATGGLLGYVCRTPALCDPVRQDCENEADGCYVIARDGTTDCAPAGDAQEEEPCTFNNDCARGYACRHPSEEEVGACVPFCDPAGDGTECADLPCSDTGWDVPGTLDPIGLCGDLGGDADSDADGDADADATKDDGGGCGCETSGARDSGAAWLGLAIALAWLGRRSRRS